MKISYRYQRIAGVIMKGFVFPSMLIIVLGGILGAAQASDAQNVKPSEVFISLDLDQGELLQALEKIELETDFRFAFNYDAINLNRRVSIQAREQSVEQILEQLLENSNITWGQSGRVILLKAWGEPDQDVEELDFLFQEVAGRVTDSQTGESLPGVNIIVVGSEATTGSIIGTQTDMDGTYSIEMPEGLNRLRFTSIGYQSQEIDVGDRTEINVELIEDVLMLEDLVVVGYGRQQRINLTGAVDQIDSRDLENRPIQNLTQGLQGAMPNVNINMIEGKPIHSPTINIRGTTSIGAGGGGSALILIDGVEGDPSMLNPNDIESVSVLKDASAAAVYGARGAFGVVLITTKQPATDQFTITYSGSIGMTQPTVDQSQYVTDGLTWANLFLESFRNWDGTFPQNANKTLPFSQDYLDEIERRTNDPSLDKTWIADDGTYRYAHSTDWFGHLFNSKALTNNHNLSFSGSADKLNYMISGRIQDQAGLVRLSSDDYQMMNLRAKGSVDVTDWFRVSNNFDFSNRSYYNPQNCCDAQFAQLDIALEGFPLAPLYNPDGTLTHSGAYALGGYAQGHNGIDLNRNVLKNIMEAEARLFEDRVRVTADFAFQRTFQEIEQKQVPVTFSRAPGVIEQIGGGSNWLRVTHNRNNFLATNFYTEYEETFRERHDFRSMLGVNYEEESADHLAARRDGLIFPGAQNIALALGEDVATAGGYSKWAILGGFYRFNYVFDDRYLVELTGRYDGSSKFPEDERFAFFPSASVGWRISNEPFWNVSEQLISHLQLRASYGSMGNGNIQTYRFQETFGIGQSGRVLDGRRPQYTRNPSVLPEGLTWETATTRNLGVNLEMLEGKLEFTGDIYVRETTDMFTIALTPPAVFGASSPLGNYADLETKGWEMMLSWRDYLEVADRPFSYNIRLSLADHKATITKYNNPDKFLNDFYEGMVIGEIWGYETDGFFTDQADIDSHADQSRFRSTAQGQYFPGDVKLRDLNGDGVINPGANTADDPGDRRIIGNSEPRYTFGINLGVEWNNFFVSTFFQGVGKRDWYPSNEANFWGQYNRPYNYVPLWHLNDGMIWSEENPDSFFPRYTSRLASSGDGILRQEQTGYLMNTAYVRLKNLQIGYNLPQSITSKLGMRVAQIYFSGENLWSWSPLYQTADNLDVENMLAQSDELARPNETIRQGYNYPMLRTLTFGISVTF